MSDKLLTYLKKSFYTGALKTLVVTISTMYFLPLIIKKIGIETYGLISMTMIFSGMTNIVDLGITKTITLKLGQAQSKIESNTIVSNALSISILTITVISFLIVGLRFTNFSIFSEGKV